MATLGPEEREGFARRGEDPRQAPKVVAGGSIAEAVCGAGVVVLAIIALTGAIPGYLASIATIVLGVGLIAHGGAVASRFRLLAEETSPEKWDTRSEIGGGMGAELVGGAGAIVLGILALLGVGTAALIPISAILVGGALLLSSGETLDLGTLDVPGAHAYAADAARQASKAASGVQALAGIGGIVLGIVALAGIGLVEVSLVALLVLGAAVLLSGAATSGRMVMVMRR